MSHGGEVTLKKLLLLSMFMVGVSSAATLNLFPPASTCVGNTCSATMGLTTLVSGASGNVYNLNWDFSNDPFVTAPYPISKITFFLDVNGTNSGPIKLLMYTQAATIVDVVVAQGSFTHAASTVFTLSDFEFPSLTAAIAPNGLFTTSLDWLNPIANGKLNSASVTIEYAPEPSTWGLMGGGLLMLLGVARRRRQA